MTNEKCTVEQLKEIIKKLLEQISERDKLVKIYTVVKNLK